MRPAHGRQPPALIFPLVVHYHSSNDDHDAYAVRVCMATIWIDPRIDIVIVRSASNLVGVNAASDVDVSLSGCGRPPAGHRHLIDKTGALALTTADGKTIVARR